jgi:integrase
MSSSMPHRLPLQDLALAPTSLRAYNTSLSSFLLHTRLSYRTFLHLPASRLDRCLAEYIQHAHDTAQPFNYASHALHAVVNHRPDIKLRLHLARLCLRGWERTRHWRSHPPLTWELTVLLACTLARWGHHGPAIGMLLAFDCYLRVSELTRLRRRDVLLPHDARRGHAATGMAIVLRHTKTGPNQSVSVQSSDVADVLCRWLQRMPTRAGGEALVFPFSPSWLRRLMHDACRSLGLDHTPYVPHSLRHGGATHDYLRTGNIEHVQFRGRWKSMESVRRYVQQANAMLAAHSVPQHLHDLGTTLADGLADAVALLLDTVPEVVPRPPGRRVTFRL